MSLPRDPSNDEQNATGEIAAEASSAFQRVPSYEEMWGRPARPVARELPTVQPDRWPVVATIVAIIIGATALIAMRERIVRILPQAAAGFRAVGLPVNLVGLELRDVRSRIVTDGARKVLVTEGQIVNIRRAETHVPAIRLAVRGANGLERYVWTEPTPKSWLEPGEGMAFRARLASPPQDGAEVMVRFARLDEAPAVNAKK